MSKVEVKTREVQGVYYVDLIVDGVIFSAEAKSVEEAIRLVTLTARSLRLIGLEV